MEHLDIPDDVWGTVFEHLPMPTLVRSARVCRRWKEISEDEALWARVWRRAYALDPPSTNIRQQCMQGGRLAVGQPKMIGRAIAHVDGATRCLFLPGSQVLSCGKQSSLCLWNFNHHAPDSYPFFTQDWDNGLDRKGNLSHYTLCYDQPTQRAISCGDDGFVNLFDMKKKACIASKLRHKNTAFGLSFVAADVFVSGGMDSRVLLHSAVDMSPVAEVNAKRKINVIQKRYPQQRSSDEMVLFGSWTQSAVGSGYISIQLLDVNTLQLTALPVDFGPSVYDDDLFCGSVCANGMILTGTRDGQVLCVDTRTSTGAHAVTTVADEGLGAILDMAVTDWYVLFVESKGSLQLWDHRKGARVWETQACQHGARGVDLDLARGLIAVASWDSSITMFQLRV